MDGIELPDHLKPPSWANDGIIERPKEKKTPTHAPGQNVASAAMHAELMRVSKATDETARRLAQDDPDALAEAEAKGVKNVARSILRMVSRR